MKSTDDLLRTLRLARQSLDSGKGGKCYRALMQEVVDTVKGEIMRRMKTEREVEVKEEGFNERRKDGIDTR